MISVGLMEIAQDLLRILRLSRKQQMADNNSPLHQTGIRADDRITHLPVHFRNGSTSNFKIIRSMGISSG